MADPTEAEFDAASERGRIARLTEPRAASAHYDRDTRRVVVELTNSCTFTFPARMTQGLEAASEDEIAAVEIQGAGHGLYWEALDADLSVPGLLAGRFGTKAHMVRLAGKAGNHSLVDVLNSLEALSPEDHFPEIATRTT